MDLQLTGLAAGCTLIVFEVFVDVILQQLGDHEKVAPLFIGVTNYDPCERLR